jgi:hypothetical protein
MSVAKLGIHEEKKSTYFDKNIEASERQDLIGTLELQYPWNKEMIAQFYSTLFFQKGNHTLQWMIDERRCVVSIAKFADHICMRARFARSKRLHNENALTKEEMVFMYVPGVAAKPPSTTNFLPELDIPYTIF